MITLKELTYIDQFLEKMIFSFLCPVSVLIEEIARRDGSLLISLRSMLLDGSLQEVANILSKALYGEPMVYILN